MPLPPAPDAPPPDGNREAEDGLDWDVDFQKILTKPERRQTHRPPGSPRREAPEANINAAPATPSEAAVKSPHGNRVPLEKKSANGTKPFTRLVTRPETAVAVNAGSERNSPERTASPNHLPTRAFGQNRNGADVDIVPNRLQGVMNEAFAHSRLKWIDQLGKARTVFLGLLLAAVFAGLVWHFGRELRLKGNETYINQELQAVLPADAVRQAGIRRAFDAYLAAADPAAKLPLVLEPQRVGPRMKDFYTLRQEKDPALASYEIGPPILAGNEWWFALNCTAPDGNKFSALMKETPDGGRLDWENYVAYGSMPWDKFVASRSGTPQSLRARLRPSTRYAGKYQAETYIACEIAHRTGPPVLHGYALRASRTGQLLAKMLDHPDWQSANVYLRWETDAGVPDSVEIADLIRNNWLDALSHGGPDSAASSAAPSAPSTPSR